MTDYVSVLETVLKCAVHVPYQNIFGDEGFLQALAGILTSALYPNFRC